MKQISVAHVVGGLNRGGAETWLAEMTKLLDAQSFKSTFIVHSNDHFDYLDEIRELGANVLVCPLGKHHLSYTRHLYKILQENGPFDIVHSHMQRFNAISLTVAKAARIPVRISHSHIDDRLPYQFRHMSRLIYYLVSRYALNMVATHGIAVSQAAALALFGDDWKSDSRYKVIHCGIDLDRFNASSLLLREMLQIPNDHLVIGHVGRFEIQKNHRFLLHLFQRYLSLQPQTTLLLIGGGSLEEEMRLLAKRLGVDHKTVFAGKRDDVADLMSNAIDVFILPSISEGLPLALLEAQAAGLPIVVSDSTADEADFPGSNIQRLSLNATFADWCSAIDTAAHAPRRPNIRTLMERSDFNSVVSAKALSDYYRTATDSMHQVLPPQ